MSGKLYEEMDRIFHPRSMAAVGVSDKMDNMGMGFLLGYRKHGFKGPLSAINPTKKFAKFEAYPSLLAVPGPVDFVNVCVPATAVPAVIEECGKKGVLAATIFTSGFRESGTEAGRELEEEVVRVARRGGVRLIGPNCMGIHCPESGMTIRADMPVTESGKIGLIAQSGGVAISTTMAAAERGLGFSKVVSFGNESDLGPPEFLHYYSRDPGTSVICLYIEGTRRAGELKAALLDAAARKPVIVLKGGATAVGDRAVTSHTGALAGRGEVWHALIRQAGAIRCDDLDEMLDLAVLNSLSVAPPGRRVGLLSVSGGFGVFGTDQIARAGLEMPELHPETRAALKQHFDAPGTSTKNPVDLAATFFQPQYYQQLFTTLDRDPGMDCFIVVLAMEYMAWLGSKAEPMADFMMAALADGLKQMNKPVYVVFFHTALEPLRLKYDRLLLAQGFPVFRDLQRCLLALNRSMARRKK
jgi:acyl-CoA synthetase (NDP forming)